MPRESNLLNKKIFHVLPLKDLVVFPHMVVPLIVGRKQSIESIELAMLDNKSIFLVAQKDSLLEDVHPKDLFRVGVVGQILQMVKLPNGLIKILVEGVARAKVSRYREKKKFIEAKLDLPPDIIDVTEEMEAKRRQLSELFKDYIKMNDEIPEEILFSFNQLEEAEKIIDFVATYLDVRIAEKQKLLERWDYEARLDHLLQLLRKENQVLTIKTDLDGRVRDEMMKSQRNFYLQEQMRIIRDELGEEDEIALEIHHLKKKIKSASMPADVHAKAMEELQRFAKIPQLSPESNVIRTYIEWLVSVPWNKMTNDTTSITAAQKILDEDHHGLEKPKKRILEYIAVLQRVKKMQGAILCLAGPPGVGKTSLGKSIARSMNREFIRISLGGVHDEAEIRGHRRTYIGSMPGKIIQGMKKAGVKNPVFLLDEVDKLGHDYHGDPASALLEVLDPEQNKSFMDHYLEVEYSLSNVMFIVTANNPYDIPDALLDRMEIIELPGYQDFEKLQIARKHLIAKQMKIHGLEKGEFQIDDESINEIIVNYTMEAGVRNLERQISKICRQAVMELLKNKRKKEINVALKNLKKYLGEPKYPSRGLKSNGEIGVATGLAWTSYGGDILRIEVNLLQGKDKLTLTGKLGDVMQESAVIAMSYIRSRSKKYNIDPEFINKYDVHIHLPEGAVPKDGPSAGITLTTAVISALKNVAYPTDIAMTGEITLRGNILAVGGLNEKLLAAKRHGIKTIILPEENKSDIKDMEAQVYEGIELKFVKHFDQVYRIIFNNKKSA
ncbi:MAG: endopeptidase La [Calditrichaceae bacterium]